VTGIPAYLRIAGDLRARILSSDLAPGAKLPTESQMMRDYGVSRTVAKWAVAVLKSESLVEGRRGSGVYVRDVPRLVREAHGRHMRTADGPTWSFARDAGRAGHRPGWEHQSEHTTADPAVAVRLAIEPDAPVMLTRYRYLADDAPAQFVRSWEPLAITSGTPIEWPEGGAAVGVVARMDHIGVHIDEFTERVTTRSAAADEIEALQLPLRGAHALVIERTYFAAGIPVETADIVIPGDRYELVYRVQVD